MTRLIVIFSLALVGCAREPNPQTYAVPTVSLAEIKTVMCEGQSPRAATVTSCHGGIDR